MNIERYGHGGDIWTAEEQLKIARETLLDFSANINPLGPPESVWQAIRGHISAITAYPDPKCRELRQVLGKTLDQPIERLLIGNGAAEILYGIMRALQPRTVGLIHPCFSEYEAAASVVGAEIVSVFAKPEQDFVPPTTALFTACEKADLFIIGYPNNPNGRLLPFEWLVRMAELLGERGAHLLVDEAFLDFLPDALSLLRHLEGMPHVLLLRSMTKFYSIPGLRLGYLIASPELISRVERELPPWGVNTLAQAAGIAGLQDREFAVRTAAWLASERLYMVEGLQQLPGVTVYGGEVNFVLLHSAIPDLQAKLGRSGLLIRNCAAYPGLGHGFYRVAVRSRAENQRFLQAMQEVAACRTHS